MASHADREAKRDKPQSALAAKHVGCGRRGSRQNHQDRQDAGAAQNLPLNRAFPEHHRGTATTNATTAKSSASESDELLLKVIQAWPRLAAARQRMIATIVETSA